MKELFFLIPFLAAFFTLGAVALPADLGPEEGPVIEVHMKQSSDGKTVYFEPVGLFIEPGTTVRWIQDRNFHSVTAYHPLHEAHEQRIPFDAEPFDSGMLTEEGDTFEWTFEVEGVYDYYSQPFEEEGMVGRIVVGQPRNGPGTWPFNYDRDTHRLVPWKAQRNFPPVNLILEQGEVGWDEL